MQEKKKKNNVLAKSLLTTWLEGEGITLYRFCKDNEIGQSLMWMWLAGDHIPSLTKAALIEELTGGAVYCRSWLMSQKPANKPKKRG